MTLGTRNSARRWLSILAFTLAAGSLQGCIGGGGGGGGGSTTSSGPQPTQTVTEEQPLQLITESPTQPTLTSPSPSQGATSGTGESGSNTSSGSTGNVVNKDPNLGTGMLELIGLNIAGAEFTSSELPGKHNTHYFFPREGDFDKWSLKGVKSVRFPIKWERLQPVLNGEFDPTYAGLIDTMFTQATRANMAIILDIHNYGRYRKNVIGSAEVPYAAYQNLMERIAKRWQGRSSLYAYDIMNEPYGDADKTWLVAAQKGIDGVRKYDRQRPIYVEGMSWSSAARWATHSNELLKLNDPMDNLVFSAHLYLDSDASGQKYSTDLTVDPMVGVKRATPFINWLKKNGKRGQIGESGIPDDPRYLEAMDNLLGYLQQNCIPMTYWAAGRAWGGYTLSAEPYKDGTDKGQWKLLEKYLGKGNCSDYGPSA
ncbi:glycoside hydrolase family 5 protein [Halopseudomonas nanhaiensis]|uniref:glycoside hydrolase family 5 protein n=1 Tax=Halopseudomonas nanhaiensis TaxID=2830842 RepID=UPI001CC00E00|nr:glycoside hydrolase family 5 protein [Halopseudomonas nanhaiensis]UAW97250.1 glycoside hydrolase family 5 protein [Halopseudomonas nanhaiensis]